ncbi:MFS transporter [Arthrobacter roseus]|uniref:MFS transporter n=1 Tax=Arthrobacter roseus TaxID=136274 RepID=UPI0019652417|nr:MFS transporter [Arthrobacter roseus]MBM7848978.1 MFS family permease [Arthrobacter roseus]
MNLFSRLPELAGKSFLPIGFVARVPLAMLTIGAGTLLIAVSGSYAVGGFAAGAVGIGSALGAPILGYLADHFGQRPVLLLSAFINTLFIAWLVVSSYLVSDYSGSGALIFLSAAFLMGGTCPQVGPLARVRWMAMASGSTEDSARDLDTALSYESTADELTFVLGPAVVGLLASLITPWLPLVLAAVITLTMVPAFAIHPTVNNVVPLRKLGASARKRDASAPRTNWLLVAIPVLGMVSMGTFFGATQTTLFAFGGTFGAATTAGLLYAVMGLSSAAAALSVAFWRRSISYQLRWIAASATMAALSAMLLLANDLVPMLVVLFILGIPVGPTMVTIFSIGSVVAPRKLMGTVMTMLASGIVAGTALGASLSGSISEKSGYTAGFTVSVGAALALLVLSSIMFVVLRRRKA